MPLPSFPAVARARAAAQQTLAGVAVVLALGALGALAPVPAVAQTPYPEGKWEPGPPKYRTVLVSDVRITMDDGVALDADIQYPADLVTGVRLPGPFPVVVEYTSRAPTPAAYFAQYGYISARVTTRGGGQSGGTPNWFGALDARDSVKVARWAAHELAGSDGRVAFQGCSDPASGALTAAANVGKNSPVKAVLALCNGFETNQRTGVLTTGVPTQLASFWFRQLPSEYFEPLGHEMMSGGPIAYERDYWKERMPMRYAKDIVDNGIPVLLWTGWRDNKINGAMRTYAAFQNAAAGRPLHAPMDPHQRATPRYQIVSGDWEHGGARDNGIQLQWLETWVRGVDTGLQKTTTPMHLYELGTNRWVNAAQYPQVPNYISWYLGDWGTLLPLPIGHARREQTLRFGDPTQAGTKLTYSTPPFPRGATLAGPVSATLYASSTSTNLLLIGTVYDVAPDGTSTQITKGAVLGSLRELDPAKTWKDRDGTVTWPWQWLTADAYLTAHRVYRFDMLLDTLQWGILPGHRLRLELTTQTRSELCPGPTLQARGTDPCYLTTPQQASVPGTYTIVHGAHWRSALNLPLLPANHFRTVASGLTPTSGTFTMPLDWGDGRGRRDDDDGRGRGRDRDDDDHGRGGGRR